jgi:hypothetical protein
MTMMQEQIKPTKQGQICKILKPLSDENPMETYLILEDLDKYSDSDIVYVVSITDLQRNIHNPTASPRKAVTKSELTVVAQNLASYVETWNKPAYPVPEAKVPTFIKHGLTFYGIMDTPIETLDKFFEEVTREELILWLSWNDPNGVYTDEDSIGEIGHVMTREEGIECMKNQLSNQ